MLGDELSVCPGYQITTMLVKWCRKEMLILIEEVLS
jgi:hypothetical protein